MCGFTVGFAISRFFPEPGNREMGGPEPVNLGFGFRFSVCYSLTINRKFSTSELKHSHLKSNVLVCYCTINFHLSTCLKSVSLKTKNFVSFCPRAYKCYLAGNYYYSVPQFSLGFHFPVLPVSVFCPFPGKFPFPVLPRANPSWIQYQIVSRVTVFPEG